MFKSEEYQIVKRIKEYIKNINKEGYPEQIIMLKNGRILDFNDYRKMVSAGKINPQDAYVYIDIGRTSSRADFYYPFLAWHADILFAYLSKLGFYYGDFIAPATGLKYVADAVLYREYLTIEVSDLDTVVNNTNLPRIIVEVLGKKLISVEKELTYEEYKKILDMFESQRPLAGYVFDEAYNIIYGYYDRGKQSLAKEVARITIYYDRIFNPYRACYETKTWKEVDCSTIT